MTREEAHTLLEVMAIELTGELANSERPVTERTKLLGKQLKAIDMAIEALSEPIDENREIIKDILQMMPTAYLLEALGVATFDELMDSERTGKWININTTNPPSFYHMGECSICGAHGQITDNFCPNCGADMRGKNNAT